MFTSHLFFHSLGKREASQKTIDYSDKSKILRQFVLIVY